MSSRTKAKCAEPTLALRLRSHSVLQDMLAAYLVGAQNDFENDWRDVLVGLAPFLDCAERLGIDPVDLFDLASEDVGPGLQDLTRGFARRTDVTLQAFGWWLEDTVDGPCYRVT